MHTAEGPTDRRMTVRELLGRYDEMGLPHFQRGMVWNSDMEGLLLESLYYDTPCGTVILWRPKKPQNCGVALPGVEPEKVRFLIIDGQQRTRTLHKIFKGKRTSETSELDDEDTNKPHVWCLNLTRIPELMDLCDSPGLIERPLFMNIVDPEKADDKSRFKNNLIPIRILLDPKEVAEPEWGWLKPKNSKEELLAKINEIRLRDRILKMWDRHLYVITKIENEDRDDLPDMVSLYIV